MRPSDVEFTEEERLLLRELRMAVFRNKIILGAQDPITEFQIAQLEQKVAGNVPPDLLALWKVSYGGALDYDYEIEFGDLLYTASLRELYYPGSDHYRDLNGWIEHELELYQEVAEEYGEPTPTRCPVIPFGGFEYLERFYTSVESGEYGVVIVYAQGIPWKGRLNEDTVSTVAENVAELFDTLLLNEDPFDEKSDEYASGKDMVAQIRNIEVTHPELAAKLEQLVRSSIVDWRTAIEKVYFKRELSRQESKALRAAFKYAVDQKDISLVDQLHQSGAPFDRAIHGKGGVLHYALGKKAFEIVNRVLDLNVDVGNAPIIHASECPDRLLFRLLKYGVIFDEEAMYSAAETGALDSSIELAHSNQLAEFTTVRQISSTAVKRADRHDEAAVKVETGRLGSYLTSEQYRQRAQSLRLFADRLEKGL